MLFDVHSMPLSLILHYGGGTTDVSDSRVRYVALVITCRTLIELRALDRLKLHKIQKNVVKMVQQVTVTFRHRASSI